MALVTSTVSLVNFPTKFEAMKHAGSDLKVMLEPERL
jgi:hypothetical protein